MKIVTHHMMFIILSLLLPLASLATTYPLPKAGNDIVGHIYTIRAFQNDTFERIGRRHNVGIHELQRANPSIDVSLPLATDTEITIPARYVLPKVREGLVLNVAELRLYYFPEKGSEVVTYPVGIGAEGRETPLGNYHIVQRREHPDWRPPQSVRADYEARGVELPDVVPAGPGNPLGDHALRLNIWSYLIHGTNEPDSIGKRSGAGCVRLYPEDVAQLYEIVPLKTPVTIINEVYKTGWDNGNLYLEVTEPLSEDRIPPVINIPTLSNVLRTAVEGQEVELDMEIVYGVAMDQRGMPAKISQPAPVLADELVTASR